MSLRFLIIWTLCVLATFAWMQMPAEDLGKGPDLAVLQHADGDVQVRRSGSLAWDRARQDMRLHAYDSLSTNTSSSASLVLEDGTILSLPAESQLKLQPQEFAQGIEISVVKGTIAVSVTEPSAQALRQRGSSNKRQKNSLPSLSPALSLITKTLRLDLSQASGEVKLSASNTIEASHPEQIKLVANNQAIRLVDIQEFKALPKVEGAATDLSALQLVQDFSAESAATDAKQNAEVSEAEFVDLMPEEQQNMALSENSESTEKLPSAATDAPPTPTPTALANMKDPSSIPTEPVPTRTPQALLLESKPKAAVPPPPEVIPKDAWAYLKPTVVNYWIGSTLTEAMPMPIRVPLKNPARPISGWNYALKVENTRSKLSRVIRPSLAETRDALLFNLADFGADWAKDPAVDLSLVLEAGLLRPGEPDRAMRKSGVKLGLALHSLALKGPHTMRLSGWAANAETDWFQQNAPTANEVVLHILDATAIPRLQSFVRGSKGFALAPYSSAETPNSLCFIRGNHIILIAETAGPEVIADLVRQLQPDLVFEGPPSALIGRRGTFNIREALDKYPAIYMSYKGRTISLDWNLLKTQEVARNFLNEIDSYFFNSDIKIKKLEKILQAH